ncbi:TetR family transcriptional regulator [Planosporangium thailandense]|uniref:TetR family transcriptional regulator n=1 Tax=Planosporangium thailandense TaxID=765197 RepID=A0ABX0Y5H3_9ACTN|nr:TetR family transcriptional regulator [Planosporangium thailandense]NJC72668.1 TetR family transcriptional regulator [Planosporangium thailandense]
MAGQRRIRDDLSVAAIELFAARGYDATTVDEIAARAGVARRTFFRHFRTKEDAVFPDHDAYLKRIQEFLDAADSTQPPLDVIREAAHLVLAMFTDDPATAVRRYRLTRQVEPLREREITASSRYLRVFCEYLHRRTGGGDEARLRDEVAAAAVVTAHNQVLRQWLRAGGTGDPHPRLDEALRSVAAALGPWLAGSRAADPGTPTPGDEVVVVVMPRGTPMWRVVQQVEAATGTADDG